MARRSFVSSLSSRINSFEGAAHVGQEEIARYSSPTGQKSPELTSSPRSHNRSFSSQKLPSIEDALEIVVDKEDADYGLARVKTKNRLLPLDNPGIYYSGGLDSDDYHWILEDGLYEGRSHKPFDDVEFEPTLFPIVDLSPSLPRRPLSTPLEITPFFTDPPLFENTKSQLRKSVLKLKVANATNERMLLRSRGRSRSPSPSPPHSPLPHQSTLSCSPPTSPSYILQVPYSPKQGTALQYMANGVGEIKRGIGNTPSIPPSLLYNSSELSKLSTLRHYGGESIMNVRHDSEFHLSKQTQIPMKHMDSVLYRNARKYGDIFDQKAQKRQSKRKGQESHKESRSRSVFAGKVEGTAGLGRGRGEGVRSSLPALHLHSVPLSPAHVLSATDMPKSARKAPSDDPLEPPARLDLHTIRQSILLPTPSPRSSGNIDGHAASTDAIDKVAKPSRSSLSPIRASLLQTLQDESTSKNLQQIISQVVKQVESVPDAAEGSAATDSFAASTGTERFESRVRDVAKKNVPSQVMGIRGSMVGFVYDPDNKLQEVVLSSQLPKVRPSSANKVVLSSLDQERQAVRIHTKVEESLVDLIARKQKLARSKHHPRKSLTNIVKIDKHDAVNEYETLVEIYHQCGGPKWINNENWCREDVPIKHWFGVAVTVEGYVFELNLPANNLTGPFPDQMCNFSHIETVYLDDNQLTGNVPDYALQKCEHLQIFSVQNNRLSGTVQFNNFNELKKIREIWLTNNQLEGPLQDGLCKLTSLTHLSLAQNRFSGSIPQNIGRLQNLLYLSLADNQLTGVIPHSMIALAELQTLSLHNNKLTGKVPDWLFALTCLEDAWLFNNCFEE